ncbi:MAG: exopolysaccharide biosynthesis protein [Rickettsiales bacterium]|nr:exopolysaccharide biosynthesis protein [Rickettsiales bacterium]
MNKKNQKTINLPTTKKEVHFLHSLKKIFNNTKSEHFTFRDILDQLKDEGLLFLIALFALPSSFPIPTPPGFTTLVGLPMCFLTIQLIFRQENTWLPEWILKKKIKATTFISGIQKLEPVMNKLTFLLKPRYQRFTTKTVERSAGAIAFLCSVSVALPILFGNAIPSAAVLIIALGFLYDDGLAVLLGMIIGVIGIITSSCVVILTCYLGTAAVKMIAYKVYDKLSWF